MRRFRLPIVLASVLTVLAGGVVAAGPAAADGPGNGAPWVVSLGDSYISGEAGRWAGNTNGSSSRVDALGPTAYFDNATATAETTPGCHRARSAEVFIGGGVNGLNLACSGARTATFTDSSGNFKPGIDFYNDASGRKGQALALQEAAATRNVRMVLLSIGGNNFNFASIVQTCVTNFLLSPSWWPNYCSDDTPVTSNFTSANVTAQTAAIANAIRNVRTAMANAGYTDAQWTLVVQTYPSPIPRGSGFRYGQSGYTRQSTGGCGFWNRDADWANATALPAINGAVRSAVAQVGAANVRILELQSALDGRRLCENTVGLLEERGVANWTAANAQDVTEWISQIRTITTVFGPYQIQESIHPNYWGQLAVRNCVRQAFNAGSPRGGACRIAGPGRNAQGEPLMTLG